MYKRTVLLNIIFQVCRGWKQSLKNSTIFMRTGTVKRTEGTQVKNQIISRPWKCTDFQAPSYNVMLFSKGQLFIFLALSAFLNELSLFIKIAHYWKRKKSPISNSQNYNTTFKNVLALREVFFFLGFQSK